MNDIGDLNGMIVRPPFRKYANRWCMVCGRHVDLRRKGAAALREEFCIQAGYRNKGYHYVCSNECYGRRK